MYQAAIRDLGTFIVSLLGPFSPVITYLLQILIGDYQFNFLTFTLLILASLAVIWFVRLDKNTKRLKNSPMIAEN